ncbi:hypothetical protein [Alicyclobacillus dauci]|uniref:Uncharacterized protein n=1 Tax=Alicyclobacillus dauci TaxID=1475485 RepID=A0ABY6Z543_9BACL|nr:hypothetical protein [Alicyclobacillus dauci]WAH37783.1 hypothetical protein NZD86_04570 [Alicyclobacillus dauci]
MPIDKTNQNDVNRVTNKIRDVFGVVSVTGVSILTLYAIVKLTPVWKKSLDEVNNTNSSRTVGP